MTDRGRRCDDKENHISFTLFNRVSCDPYDGLNRSPGHCAVEAGRWAGFGASVISTMSAIKQHVKQVWSLGSQKHSHKAVPERCKATLKLRRGLLRARYGYPAETHSKCFVARAYIMLGGECLRIIRTQRALSNVLDTYESASANRHT